MDDEVAAARERADARITALVRTHGWCVQYVAGDTCVRPACWCEKTGAPAFAYSIGLHSLGHPELLMFGVPLETAMGVINELGSRVRAGDALVSGEVVTFDQWPHRVVPEPVPNAEKILLAAVRYYGIPVAALQLSYDDLAGRFPWEPGYEAPTLQPRPGTFTA